jgi:hypothetical protein
MKTVPEAAARCSSQVPQRAAEQSMPLVGWSGSVDGEPIRTRIVTATNVPRNTSVNDNWF